MTRRHFHRPTAKPVRNTAMMLVRQLHTRLTVAEVADCIEPLRACFTAMREGRITHHQYLVLNTHLLIALEIERKGIVRGLQAHIDAALAAATSYAARCGTAENWQPGAMYFHEIDAIDTALDLHKFQIEQLTAHELNSTTDRFISRIQTEGGKVFEADNDTSALTPYKKKRKA